MQFFGGILVAGLVIALVWTVQPGRFQDESDYLFGKDQMPEQQVSESTPRYDMENPMNLTEPCIPGTELDKAYSAKKSQGLTTIQHCSSQADANNGNTEVCACFKIGSRYWWVIENWQTRLTEADYENYPALRRGNYSEYATWEHLNITGCELNKTQCQEPYQAVKLYPLLQ